MKISKDLLKKIALGVCFAGAITACDIHDDPLHDNEVCAEGDDRDECDGSGGDWEYCYACGMG